MTDAKRRVKPYPATAVLGAGIMGSSVALLLARKGFKVVLIDAAPSAFMGASRWNEGKIHLGYLYSADPSLKTAQSLIPGGVAFPSLVKDLLGRDVKDAVTPGNETYLIHRRSVASADDAFGMACRISELCREYPDCDRYFVPLSRSRPRLLSRSELEGKYNSQEIVAAYEVPERSVSTKRLADYFVEALVSEKCIEPLWRRRVVSVRKKNSAGTEWFVDVVDGFGNQECIGPFGAVVNALWEGRGEIDASVGISPSRSWTHRYRVSLFARTREPVELDNAVIAVGPFGDVKNYDGRNLYLSWYEAGLLEENREVRPPSAPKPNGPEVIKIMEEKFKRLAELIPGVMNVRSDLEGFQLRGGWVYASGGGPLSDPRSGLHRRDDIGVKHLYGYFSVDTGKYSMAPLFACEVASAIFARYGCG
ncbi:MAG: FAD-dependent oxidoreductase [Gammaproteobacteria bacterium]